MAASRPVSGPNFEMASLMARQDEGFDFLNSSTYPSGRHGVDFRQISATSSAGLPHHEIAKSEVAKPGVESTVASLDTTKSVAGGEQLGLSFRGRLSQGPNGVQQPTRPLKATQNSKSEQSEPKNPLSSDLGVKTCNHMSPAPLSKMRLDYYKPQGNDLSGPNDDMASDRSAFRRLDATIKGLKHPNPLPKKDADVFVRPSDCGISIASPRDRSHVDQEDSSEITQRYIFVRERLREERFLRLALEEKLQNSKDLCIRTVIDHGIPVKAIQGPKVLQDNEANVFGPEMESGDAVGKLIPIEKQHAAVVKNIIKYERQLAKEREDKLRKELEASRIALKMAELHAEKVQSDMTHVPQQAKLEAALIGLLKEKDKMVTIMKERELLIHRLRTDLFAANSQCEAQTTELRDLRKHSDNKNEKHRIVESIIREVAKGTTPNVDSLVDLAYNQLREENSRHLERNKQELQVVQEELSRLQRGRFNAARTVNALRVQLLKVRSSNVGNIPLLDIMVSTLRIAETRFKKLGSAITKLKDDEDALLQEKQSYEALRVKANHKRTIDHGKNILTSFSWDAEPTGDQPVA